ncbi:MAG: efflux RND transporter periplasmic adaptor subunit [Parasphingopyxis sp.]
MIRKPGLSLLPLLLGMATACSGGEGASMADAEQATEAEAPETETAPARAAAIVVSDDQMQRLGITVAQAESTSEMPLATVPATVVLPPNARMAVAAPFAGAIRQVFVIEGQTVTRGQRLATVFSQEAVMHGAELSRARARLNLAQANASRTRQLAREGVIAGARAQEANAALREAQVDVRENSRILGATGADASGTVTLRAPISGRVASVTAEAGSGVDGMTAPFVIEAQGAYQLALQLPERLIGNVRPGMTVQIPTPGPLSGRILSVGGSIDPQTRSATAVASIPGAPGIVAGSNVRATILGDAPDGALAIPASAVTRIDGDEVVFVRTANGFALRRVRLAGRAGETAVVAEGLNAGENVATSGISELRLLASES